MRVGMVGLAALYWPMTLGRGLQGREGVEFCAAATLGVDDANIRDTLGISAAEYAQRFGVKLYSQAEEMVAAERLDTVVLITRHTEHADWAERMARLGVDIFIPKTFATTLDDAERIARAQECYGVKIAVGPSARYLPPMMAVKEALDGGLIGKPFALRICHHHGTIDAFHPRDWDRELQEGGRSFRWGGMGLTWRCTLWGRTSRVFMPSTATIPAPIAPSWTAAGSQCAQRAMAWLRSTCISVTVCPIPPGSWSLSGPGGSSACTGSKAIR